MVSNFKYTSSAKMLAVLAVATGAKFQIKLVDGTFVYGDRTHGSDGNKEVQNATLLRKFLRDYMNTIPGTPESKIKQTIELLKPYLAVNTFRTLNNTVRRVTDDGTLWPIGRFFYEGTSHPSKRVEVPVAPAKKTRKATAKTTPAPVIPAKTSKKPTIAAISKATPKAATKATPKAVKTTAPATQPKAVRKPKPVIVSGDVAPLQSTPVVDTVLEPAAPLQEETPVVA